MNASQPPIIGSQTITLFDLFCSGRFEVPWHQRLYDWKPEHVEELLLDLEGSVRAGRNCYFVGTIILVKAEKDRWRINDGQQRMVTLSLVFASLRQRFVELGDSLREHQARRLLFDIDAAGSGAGHDLSRLTPRITPPRDDRLHFNHMIRGERVGANGHLLQAWRKIDGFVQRLPNGRESVFFDFLIQRVEVACLDIPQTVDANLVFETINCRGKQLDDLDMIRNHLYSYFNGTDETTRRETVHDVLEDVRIHLVRGSKYSEYARCFFQSRYGHLPQTVFYRETRRHIQEAAQAHVGTHADYVYSLTQSLGRPERVTLFRVIDAPSQPDDFLNAVVAASGHANRRRNIATFLQELSRYKVTRPLVFSLLCRCMDISDAERRLMAKWIHNRIRNLNALVMRTAFVAPKFEPSRFEAEITSLARQVMAAPIEQVRDVKIDDGLSRCDTDQSVLDDARFVEQVGQLELKDPRRAKAFLYAINAHDDPQGGLLKQTRCSVEHILPKAERHWNGWNAFSRNHNPAHWVHRLGNLTVLAAKDNRPGDKDNRNFAAKRDAYAESLVAMTKRVASYSEWSPETVEERQKELAKLAAKTWAFRSANPA